MHPNSLFGGGGGSSLQFDSAAKLYRPTDLLYLWSYSSVFIIRHLIISQHTEQIKIDAIPTGFQLDVASLARLLVSKYLNIKDYTACVCRRYHKLIIIDIIYALKLLVRPVILGKYSTKTSRPCLWQPYIWCNHFHERPPDIAWTHWIKGWSP